MNVRLTLGTIILTALLIIGLVLPYFADGDPTIWRSVPRNRPPGLDYLLGTTSQGQDVFWLLAWSLQNTLCLGLLVGFFATLIGVLVGLLAGYLGGVLDTIVSFLTDSLIVIPILPVLILISALLQGQMSLEIVGFILVLFNWPYPARQVRSIALSLRERGFIQTAWQSGENVFRIVWWQFAPYLRSWSAANFINTVLVATVIESSIAVIGLSSSTQATIGTMLYWALEYQAILNERWWWICTPIVAVVLLFVALFITATGYETHSAKMRGREFAR